MTIGQMKQAIRQKCRLDQRLTDAYMLISVIEGMSRISAGTRVMKREQTIAAGTFVSGTYNYALLTGTLSVEKVEYGTVADFADNQQETLDPIVDYKITKSYTDPTTLNVQQPYLILSFDPDATYMAKVYCSILIDDLLAAVWADDAAQLDTVVPRNAVLPLIEYVAQMHKKNWQGQPTDKEDFANVEQDIAQAFNERVEYP